MSIKNKLRKFRGISWFSSVVSLLAFGIAGVLTGVSLYIKIANLIGLLYFAWASGISESSKERILNVFCCIVFLILFLGW